MCTPDLGQVRGMTKPIAPPPAARAERERIMSILALPAAKSNRPGAEALAFGSDASPAEAAATLARAADSKAAARATGRASMLRACGLPPEQPQTLSAGEVSMLKIAAQSGPPEQRSAARAKLKSGGVS